MTTTKTRSRTFIQEADAPPCVYAPPSQDGGQRSTRSEVKGQRGQRGQRYALRVQIRPTSHTELSAVKTTEAFGVLVGSRDDPTRTG
ncbi:hypothetical protein EYF80_057341 [Liparis tanakae]|uniref:Uncharacterized protein n=1 Tax=Liparis tanakae TaxID=230148 RepID=A0A4Z2EU96_9TELE|nr:hypothetical protein EYF80_057341 [Liparis tanakae]